jgi:thiosulfate/3-mercaptopyruvate sulfurtransferase
MTKRAQFFIAVAVLLPAIGALAQQRTISVPPLRSSMVVSTDWLADHERDPRIVVVHVGRDRASYDAGHIPGARFLSLGEIAVPLNGVANELPPIASLQKTFESIGIGDGSRVILYGDLHGLLAARAYWTLDYLGHGDRAALLDGGLEKWRAEERPVTTDVPAVTPTKFTPRPNPKVLVDLATVRRISKQFATGHSRYVLVDARSAPLFAGEQKGDVSIRAGHIPGAVNIPWTQNIESNDNPELKPAPEVRNLWAAASGKRVVVYCQTGIQASLDYFVAKFLGYDVAMYDGSFMEWSAATGAPVETGGRRP